MNESLREQLLLLPEYFQGHLILTLAALSLGIVISIPLGIWAAQSVVVKRPLLTIVSIIQTFPSVAILALVVALLGGQIGIVPAIIALVLYSMLPIVRNTVSGLETVADEVVEAAQGIGMSSYQILTRVRIPLALPVIIAGIRTAAVWTVGLATLSTLVGATSFGNYIFTGLQTRNLVSVTVGSIAAALMAVVLDSLIGGIQWLVENKNQASSEKKYKQVKYAIIGALILSISFSAYSLLPEPETDFTIGGKGFTEQYIIAGLLSAELEAAGFSVEQRLGMGTEVVYTATANNTVDVYLEYTGTVWANIMNNSNNPGRDAVLAGVTEFIEGPEGMVNIGALGFQNRYALAMRKDRAQELGVTSIEDLIPIARDLIAAGDLEFFGRPEWITLRDTYNIDFAQKLTFDPTLMYTAINEEQVDLIAGYTSDGRIAAFDLLLLEDPRNALLPYDSFLLASSTAAENALFTETLESLVNAISDDEMRAANRIVDVDGGAVSDAVAYLQSVIR
ncbi:MAG: ABC transporter permease/substrate-binding protein [Gammaproteobacteria bacterium]|nr:ABC transporter permease/substrate-binding protein [Gammaproteobacteria bacterium]MDD9958782.1 ABC transporter permease/substrate-binding protein [Gammaproteobacteria bacterium]